MANERAGKIKGSVKIALASLVAAGALATGVFTLSVESMTYDEYQTYLEMVNYEIAKSGGTITVVDIKDKKDFMKKLDKLIEKREIIELNADIGGERLTKDEYKTLRAGLLKKHK